MKRKVKDLTEQQVNFLVAKLEGYEPRYNWMHAKDGYVQWQSTEGAWGNPIIGYCFDRRHSQFIMEREGIATWKNGNEWRAAHPLYAEGYYDPDDGIIDMGRYDGQEGHTQIEAALKAYIAAKLGSEVEIPEDV